MGSGAHQVFLGVGQEYLPEHRTLLTHVINELHSVGLSEIRLTREHYDPITPIVPVVDAIRSCDGVIIVAFPRIIIRSGAEMQGASNEQAIDRRNIATPWLQIEASLGYGWGFPLLILVDDRLHPEGLLNPNHAAYNALFYNMAESQSRLSSTITGAITAFASRIGAFTASKRM
jgi:hypothetical protein